MKARFDAASLRLRVDEDELARLLDGTTLRLSPRVSGRLLFDLHLTLGDAPAFDACENTWRTVLPRKAVAAYAATLPQRDGLGFGFGEADAAWRIVFEVDVRDSVARRGPPTPR